MYAGSDIAFADFLIHSHVYIFRVESGRRSSVWIDYGGHAEEKAAETVVEFFGQLFVNPRSLQMFDYEANLNLTKFNTKHRKSLAKR